MPRWDLSRPGAVGRRARFRPRCDAVEPRILLSTFTVTNVNNAGDGSLRQAITDANNNGGTNTIAFDIAGTGPQVIRPLSALPPITGQTIIDGYTQPGSKPNTSSTGDNETPMIVIDGSAITNISQSLGLQIQSDDSTVEGLSIEDFGGIGLVISGTDDVIQGDFIGTSPTGMAAAPNSLGIGDYGAGSVIGGTTPADRDLISGNDIGAAIASLSIGGSSLLTSEAGSVIQGDLIGTDATGAGNLGNSVIGVALAGSGNVVGGTAAGQANTIAFNGEDGSTLNIGVGVVVLGLSPDSSSPISVQSTGNLISGNSIYDNHNMGIGLLDVPTSTVLPLLSTSTAQIPSVVAGFLGSVDLGVVPDAQFPSGSGPNDLLNFPDLATAVTQGGTTTVRGTLDSTPNTTFQVQFFSSPAAGSNGYGEGQVYLGATTVTTGSNGLATIDYTTPAPVAAGQVIAATAIDPSNNTSEFSRAVAVTPPAPSPVYPQVVSTQRFTISKKASSIVLTFGEQLNPSSAEDTGNYTLDLLKRHRHSVKARAIPIASATYDPTALTVTLSPKRRLKPHATYQLTISGTGVTDLDGDPLVGSDGKPGSNYTTVLGAAIKAPKST